MAHPRISAMRTGAVLRRVEGGDGHGAARHGDHLHGHRRMSGPDRLFLSPPHMSGEEEELVADAFRSNWIAPLGPHVDAFEEEFARHVGAAEAVALSSGTAALHLALQLVGVGPGDDVFVSDFTFVASVNPIRCVGAVPTLIDAEPTS